MLEEHHGTCELREAEEVFDEVFPSCDQPAVVLHPGKDPFDFPAAAIATQGTIDLCLMLALEPVGRDHLDADTLICWSSASES